MGIRVKRLSIYIYILSNLIQSNLIYLSIYLSMYVYTYVYLYILYVHICNMYVGLSVTLSIHLSVCLSIYVKCGWQWENPELAMEVLF